MERMIKIKDDFLRDEQERKEQERKEQKHKEQEQIYQSSNLLPKIYHGAFRFITPKSFNRFKVLVFLRNCDQSKSRAVICGLAGAHAIV